MVHDWRDRCMVHRILCNKLTTVLTYFGQLEPGFHSWFVYQDEYDVPSAGLVRCIHRRLDPVNAFTLGK